jgi:hypothetical protein
MSKPIGQVWTFRSDSDPDTQYKTLRYADGSTSCGYKGWTRRVAADGSRSCKHTRWVDQGMADRHCIATHNYETPQTQPLIKSNAQIKTAPRLGQRTFAV